MSDTEQTIVGPDISKEEMRLSESAMDLVAKSMFILWNRIPKGWSINDVRYEHQVVHAGLVYSGICRFVVDITKD